MNNIGELWMWGAFIALVLWGPRKHRSPEPVVVKERLETLLALVFAYQSVVMQRDAFRDDESDKINHSQARHESD